MKAFHTLTLVAIAHVQTVLERMILTLGNGANPRRWEELRTQVPLFVIKGARFIRLE